MNLFSKRLSRHSFTPTQPAKITIKRNSTLISAPFRV
nr:MAG TPA: hypothetical protein [Caudoviricetes sp.]